MRDVVVFGEPQDRVKDEILKQPTHIAGRLPRYIVRNGLRLRGRCVRRFQNDRIGRLGVELQPQVGIVAALCMQFAEEAVAGICKALPEPIDLVSECRLRRRKGDHFLQNFRTWSTKNGVQLALLMHHVR